QAEDGIRDFHVTGVQTCALPISTSVPPPGSAPAAGARTRAGSGCPSSVTVARQPSSTTVVAFASAMIAGPVTVAPAGSAPRRYSGTVSHSPCHIRTRAAAPPAGSAAPAAGSVVDPGS